MTSVVKNAKIYIKIKVQVIICPTVSSLVIFSYLKAVAKAILCFTYKIGTENREYTNAFSAKDIVYVKRNCEINPL